MAVIITIIPVYAQNELEMNIPCSDCHSSDGWALSENRIFDHNETLFPLKGQHESIQCKRCHAGSTAAIMHQFESTSVECISCHIDIHTNRYGTDCERCHRPSSWNMDNWWDQHNETQFPLTGRHSAVPCQDCHKSISTNLYYSLSSDCFNCHQLTFEEFHQPGDNINCFLCHSTLGWDRLNFNHTEEETGFALLGIHRITSCSDCHTEGQFSGVPSSCGADTRCHLDDFSATSNEPNHIIFGYPLDYCEDCHTPKGWTPNTYTHSPITACVTCHMPDYESTSDPFHEETSGFTTTCENCHFSTSTWEGAFFDHSITTKTCVSCHQTDYDDTVNPDHQLIGYSTDCTECHNSTSDWKDVTFDHNFPIGVSAHQQKDPETCLSCHLIEQDYSQFTCMSGSCHLQGDTDSEHTGLPDYQYDAIECYTCHPDGEKEMISHDALYFPIYSGKHNNEWDNCSECHVFGDLQTFSCTEASGCHEHIDSEMDDKHCENPSNCESCNNTTYDPGISSSDQCMVCHPTGDEDDCNGGGDENRRGKLKEKIKSYKLPEFR